jgi:hypothetical protein
MLPGNGRNKWEMGTWKMGNGKLDKWANGKLGNLENWKLGKWANGKLGNLENWKLGPSTRLRQAQSNSSGQAKWEIGTWKL